MYGTAVTSWSTTLCTMQAGTSRWSACYTTVAVDLLFTIEDALAGAGNDMSGAEMAAQPTEEGA